MAQLNSTLVNKAFGEVNVWPQNGLLHVKATILMKPRVENAQTGLALDGSASMQDLFGYANASDIFPAGSPFGRFIEQKPNYVQPVACKMASYLANFDSDGETTVIYFACGREGKIVEEVGDMSSDLAAKTRFVGPKSWGTGTRLVPAMQFYLERFKNAPWLICLFITDGKIDDVEAAKALSRDICLDMQARRRGFTKFVIIGLGREFSDSESEASQSLETLDDLDQDPVYGVEGQDLWDHKIAVDMRCLEEIFAEVVSENMIVAPSAQVIDNYGNPVRPLDDVRYEEGLPSLLNFYMPATATSFTVILPNGMRVEQDITSVLPSAAGEKYTEYKF